MGPNSSERRLGVRHEVAVGIGWHVDRIDYRLPWQRRRSPLSPQHGEMRDLSVTGATVLGPRAGELQIGSRTVIQVMGVTGTVIIRRITPCADPSLSIYGIEFAEPNSTLTAMLYDTFLRDHPTALESQSHHSRSS